mgnify:CR=1 FL=1
MKHAIYFLTVLAICIGIYTMRTDVLEIYPQDITMLDNERCIAEIYGKQFYIGQEAADILTDNDQRDMDLEMVAVFRTHFFGIPFVTSVEVVIFEDQHP